MLPGPFEKHWLGNLGNLGSSIEIQPHLHGICYLWHFAHPAQIYLIMYEKFVCLCVTCICFAFLSIALAGQLEQSVQQYTNTTSLAYSICYLWHFAHPTQIYLIMYEEKCCLFV